MWDEAPATTIGHTFLWDRVFEKIRFKLQSWDAETRVESGSEAFTILGRYVAWVRYRRFGTTELACLNTLRTGDAYLRFYVTTVQDG